MTNAAAQIGDDDQDDDALAAQMDQETDYEEDDFEEEDEDLEDEDSDDDDPDEDQDDDDEDDDEDEDDDDDGDGKAAAKRVEFSPEQQEVFDATVGKKAAKLRETEQALEAANRQLREKDAALARFEEPQRPELPPEPDPDAFDYQEQQQRFTEGLRAQAAYDARQEVLQKQKADAEQKRREAEEAVVMQSVGAYNERAEELKIDPNRLRAAGEKVRDFGIPDDLALHIIGDQEGPAITVYLGENPLELDTVGRMPPMQAAVYLEGIKRKIAENRKPGKRPPKPQRRPKGRHAPDLSEDGKYGKVF